MVSNLDRRGAMLLLAAAPGLISSSAAKAAPAAMPGAGDPVRDFDWLYGAWRVQHHRLKARLANNDDWEDFDGTCVSQPLLAGAGNVDDNVINIPSGSYRGIGLRAYDPKTATWAIWWVDSRYPHTIDPPVIGGFKDGVGTFIGADTLRGKPVTARFLWSRITPTTAHWEQALSPDGGATWETNWRMDFTRTA